MAMSINANPHQPREFSTGVRAVMLHTEDVKARAV